MYEVCVYFRNGRRKRTTASIYHTYEVVRCVQPRKNRNQIHTYMHTLLLAADDAVCCCLCIVEYVYTKKNECTVSAFLFLLVRWGEARKRQNVVVMACCSSSILFFFFISLFPCFPPHRRYAGTFFLFFLMFCP